MKYELKFKNVSLSEKLKFENVTGNNNNAEAVGLKTADILAYVKDEDLILETTDGQVLALSASGATPMTSLSSTTKTSLSFSFSWLQK